jgi:hypothetical protein
MHSLTLGRSGIMPCHGGIDTRLIQEHTLARLQLTYLLLMEVTLGLDRFTVTLGYMISLFFRVSLSRTRVRCILDRLGVT